MLFSSFATLGYALSAFVLSDEGKLLQQLQDGDPEPLMMAWPIATGLAGLGLVHELAHFIQAPLRRPLHRYLLIPAHICSYLLIYAHTCSNMLIPAHTCSYLLHITSISPAYLHTPPHTSTTLPTSWRYASLERHTAPHRPHSTPLNCTLTPRRPHSTQAIPHEPIHTSHSTQAISPLHITGSLCFFSSPTTPFHPILHTP